LVGQRRFALDLSIGVAHGVILSISGRRPIAPLGIQPQQLIHNRLSKRPRREAASITTPL
jgi:hypothetical protein